MTTERLATAACALGMLAYAGLSHVLAPERETSPPPASVSAPAAAPQVAGGLPRHLEHARGESEQAAAADARTPTTPRFRD